MEIYRYGEVTSTNDIAKDLARQGIDAAVVIAESQSAGRGRRGRNLHKRSHRDARLYRK